MMPRIRPCSAREVGICSWERESLRRARLFETEGDRVSIRNSRTSGGGTISSVGYDIFMLKTTPFLTARRSIKATARHYYQSHHSTVRVSEGCQVQWGTCTRTRAMFFLIRDGVCRRRVCGTMPRVRPFPCREVGISLHFRRYPRRRVWKRRLRSSRGGARGIQVARCRRSYYRIARRPRLVT